MIIKEITEYGPQATRELDALMRELSPRAAATGERVRKVVETPDMHLYAAFEEGRMVADARLFGVQQLHLTSNPRREAANGLYRALGFEKKETNVYIMDLHKSD